MKTFLLLLLSFPCLAQCDYARNSKDKFTGHNIIQTYAITASSSYKGVLQVAFSKVDEQYFLSIAFLTEHSAKIVQSDSRLILLFTDETTLEVYPAKSAVSKLQRYQFRLDVNYILTPEDVQKLSFLPIESYRIYFSDSFFESKVKGEERIMKAAGCVL